MSCIRRRGTSCTWRRLIFRRREESQQVCGLDVQSVSMPSDYYLVEVFVFCRLTVGFKIHSTK